MSESEIKVGDKFLVEVEVVTLGHIGKDFMLVRGPLSETYGTNAMHRDQLLASKRIEPALKVGDKVRTLTVSDTWTGVIVAIHAEHAWVEWQAWSGKYPIYPLSSLERVL